MEIQQQKIKYNNTASNLLFASAGCYGVAFVLPAITINDFSIYISFRFYEFLSLFGIALLLGSIGLVVLGARKTKEGISVKRFAWGSLISIIVVLFPVMAFMLLNLISVDAVKLGIGTYVIFLGMILAFVGGLSSTTYIYQQTPFQQQGYQKPQAQNPQNFQNTQYQNTQGQYQQNYQQPNPQPTDNRSTIGNVFCSQCGSKHDGVAKFCNNCGEVFK